MTKIPEKKKSTYLKECFSSGFLPWSLSPVSGTVGRWNRVDCSPHGDGETKTERQKDPGKVKRPSDTTSHQAPPPKGFRTSQ